MNLSDAVRAIEEGMFNSWDSFDFDVNQVLHEEISLRDEMRDEFKVGRTKMRTLRETHTSITKMTLLHFAVYHRCQAAVEKLIDEGASQSARCSYQVHEYATSQKRSRGKWVNSDYTGRQLGSHMPGNYTPLDLAYQLLDEADPIIILLTPTATPTPAAAPTTFALAAEACEGAAATVDSDSDDSLSM